MPLQRGTACLQCRRRKLRCDGLKPTCAQCTSHDREASCSYEDPKSWGKHRQLQLQIGELQNQLGATIDNVRFLTTALHAQQCQSSKTPAVAPSSQSSGSVHSPPLESPPSNTDGVTIPLMEYVQPDMSGNGHVIGPQSYPTELASEPHRYTISLSYSQLNISAESQGLLLKRFLPHAEQFHLDLNAKQVMSRIEGPPHSLPHDAFLHAMFLIGFRFNEIAPNPRHEARFRQRVQGSLRQPMTCQSDRRDCIRAACLLAGYFYATDCLSEAQQHVSIASRLACSLPLESPLGGVSLEDELLLKQVHTIDRLITAYLGVGELSSAEMFAVPGANLEGPFQTRSHLISAWTVTLEACLVPSPMQSSYAPSEIELLDRKAFGALRARAADLLWIASRVTDTSASSEPSSNQILESTAMEGVNFDMARLIDRIQAGLPSLKPQTVTELPVLCLHTMVYASLLHILQGDLLRHREVCDGLVGELIALIRELWDHDYKILEPIMGLCWQWLVEHLLDRVRRQNEHIGQLGELIKFTLLAMNKLAWELPIVSVNITNVATQCTPLNYTPPLGNLVNAGSELDHNGTRSSATNT